LLQRFLEPLRQRIAARLLILHRPLEQRFPLRRLIRQDSLRFVQLRPIGLGGARCSITRPRLTSTTSVAWQQGQATSISLFRRAIKRQSADRY
jgi:hypothetical protein